MVKWEYCRLSTEVRNLIAGETQKYTLEFMGKSREPEDVTDVDDCIAKLGLEGWELVILNVTELPSEEYTEYLFKRQIEA